MGSAWSTMDTMRSRTERRGMVWSDEEIAASALMPSHRRWIRPAAGLMSPRASPNKPTGATLSAAVGREGSNLSSGDAIDAAAVTSPLKLSSKDVTNAHSLRSLASSEIRSSSDMNPLTCVARISSSTADLTLSRASAQIRSQSATAPVTTPRHSAPIRPLFIASTRPVDSHSSKLRRCFFNVLTTSFSACDSAQTMVSVASFSAATASRCACQLCALLP